LGLLVTGVFLTWWAPAAPTNPLAYLNVNHQGAKTCGTLLSADGGVLDLAIPGAHEPAVIPLTTVTNFTLMTSCPAP